MGGREPGVRLSGAGCAYFSAAAAGRGHCRDRNPGRGLVGPPSPPERSIRRQETLALCGSRSTTSLRVVVTACVVTRSGDRYRIRVTVHASVYARVRPSYDRAPRWGSRDASHAARTRRGPEAPRTTRTRRGDAAEIASSRARARPTPAPQRRSAVRASRPDRD